MGIYRDANLIKQVHIGQFTIHIEIVVSTTLSGIMKKFSLKGNNISTNQIIHVMTVKVSTTDTCMSSNGQYIFMALL